MNLPRPVVSVLGSLLGAILFSALYSSTVLTHDPVPSVTWHRDVEPIARARCLSCHQPGGAALPTLASHEDFKLHRVAVKAAVLGGTMPPWLAMRGFGAFRDERALSPLQISLFASWIEAGTPVRAIDGEQADSSSPFAGEIAPSGWLERIELSPFTSQEPTKQQTIDASALRRGMIRSWHFRPGDPTIRSARVFSAGRLLWTASAGFLDDAYPPGTGLRVEPAMQFTVEIVRRTHDADGTFRAPKKTASRLEIEISPEPVTELKPFEANCGTQPVITGTLYGVRPVASDAPMEIRRLGRAPSVLGLFRSGHSEYRVTYWFREAAHLARGERLDVRGDKCSVTLFVASPGSKIEK